MEAVPGEGELTPVVHRGPAAELHALEPTGDRAEAWWLEVTEPALVLGSTQPPSVVAAEADLTVVKRRSGGGAVLVIPGELLWLDVIVPRGDARWDDDVGRSMWWLGDAWAGALRSVGVEDVDVHRGPLVSTRWSRLVCFDGLGAGEVTVAGRKAVGISQRRTRSWARMQTTLHLEWRPEAMVALLAEPRPRVDELAEVWTLPTGVDIRVALEEQLAP